MFRKTTTKYILIFLLFFIGFMLYFQWDGFSSETKPTKIKEVLQNITIEHKNNTFFIKQTIKSVEKGEYKIEWPNNAKKIKCFNENNQECKWKSSERTHITINHGDLILQYEIKHHGNNSTLLLNNWIAKLNHLFIGSTEIQLIEGQFKEGFWIAAAEKETMKQKKLINYFVFDVNGQAPPLFWHRNGLAKKEVNSWLTVYYQKSTKLPNFNMNGLKKIRNNKKIIAVLTNDYPQTFLSSFLIINEDNSKSLEEYVVQEAINQLYSFKNEEKWMKEIIASVILNKGVGSPKAKFMYSELKKNLNNESLNEWKEQLLSSENLELTSDKLDLLIEDVTGFGTNFFKENYQIQSPNKTFILYDPRTIIIKGKERNDIHLFTIGDKNFLSLNKIAGSLGYKLITKKDSLVLKNAKTQYEFFIGKKIFTYNGEKYGVLSNPFIKIDNEFFIDIHWIDQLFGINLQENDQQLLLQ